MTRTIALLVLVFSLAGVSCGSEEDLGESDETVRQGDETPRTSDNTPTESDQTPRGKIAFASERDGNFEIYVINADGTGITNLTNHPSDDGGGGFHVEDPNFAWSPDGRRMAFISDRDGNPEIYLMNADGTAQERLTTSEAQESQLQWSPDGTRIAFVSTVRDPANYDEAVHVMSIDGGEPTRIGGDYSQYPAWSPDGRRIAFAADDIYVADADGAAQTNLTAGDEIGEGNETYFAPAWSPDGSQIAFDAYSQASSGDLYQQLYIINADGTNLIQVPDGATEDNYYSDASWSPGGTRIVFSTTEAPGPNLHVVDADGSNQSRVTESFALVGVWSPHGDIIAALGANVGIGGERSPVLFLIEPDGSGKREVTTELGDTYFAWSPVP